MGSPQRDFLVRDMGTRTAKGVGLLGVLLMAGACTSSEVGALCPLPANASAAQKLAAICGCQSSLLKVVADFYRRPQLDLLLVVGNTRSMVKKQQEFAAILPELFSRLDEQHIDYHIGVVSTDVGSWTAADAPWTMSAGACDSFAGDDGRLQASSCLNRSANSAAAGSACAAVCPDRKFLPNDGRPFLARDDGKVNVPVALMTDPKTGQVVDNGPVLALQCLAMLGDGGCRISSPLESARRALDGHLAANRGFRRPDATLYVLFLTDGDDCSVSLARRGDNDPHTQSCASPDADAGASCYSLGAYRCLARDVVCAQPLNVAGAKTGCRERADSYLTPVADYIRFFTSLGPAYRMGVGGIWTLPALTPAAELRVAQNPNVAGSAGLDFAADDPAGCAATGDPTYTGQPQLRLAQLFAALNPESNRWGEPLQPVNVCAPADYVSALEPFAVRIIREFGPSCLPDLPATLPDGSPACMVGDVPLESPDAAPETLLPVCGATCCTAFSQSYRPPQLDPLLQSACAAEPADCYCAVPTELSRCRFSGATFGVWRKDNRDAPPGTALSIQCARQCPAPSGN